MEGPRRRFTGDMYELLKQTRCINAKLYNFKGQVLIYPKVRASDEEMDRLWRFLGQGVYFNVEDEELLFGKVKFNEGPVKAAESPVQDLPPPPDGLSNVRLISRKTAEDLSRDTSELLEELKGTPLLVNRSGPLRAKLEQVFHDFENHPDAMNGLVNIIELLGGMDVLPEPQKAVKRTVVAMAMKTRGMKAQNNRDRLIFDKMVSDLMMSAILCDVGLMRMKPVNLEHPSPEELKYYRTHPLYSYILIVQDESLSPSVKFTVLSQHRPLFETTAESNNYPDVLWLREKLRTFAQNYNNEQTRALVRGDVERQLANLQKGLYYDEDISILSIASRFAELTTDQPGQPAMTPVKAVRQIINDGFYTYPDRIVREFLDHISMSLCENQKILKEGDFVVLQSYAADKSLVWEVGRVLYVNRYQSRPVVVCFAGVRPNLVKEPELAIKGFAPDSVKPFYRPIRVTLEGEFQRRIVYLFDEKDDAVMLGVLRSAYSGIRLPQEFKEGLPTPAASL